MLRLNEVPPAERWRLLASLSGRKAHLSEAQQEALDEKLEDHVRAVQKFPDNPRAQKAYVEECKALSRTLKFLKRLATALWKYEREQELDQIFADAEARGHAPRHLQEQTGLRMREINYRLANARGDARRRAQGLPTRAETRQAERVEHMRQLKIAVERSKMPDGQRRGRGRPRGISVVKPCTCGARAVSC